MLAKVVQAAVPGAKIIDLCVLGDKSIEEGTAAVYNKSKFERGVAFPTCVSVNNCAGHFSPLTGDNTVLQEGDLVKVYVSHLLSCFHSLPFSIATRSRGPLDPSPLSLKFRKRSVSNSDLGAHIDGFITQGAHSFVCTANKDQPATGRHADVICAAYFAAQAALRLFKAGKTVRFHLPAANSNLRLLTLGKSPHHRTKRLPPPSRR